MGRMEATNSLYGQGKTSFLLILYKEMRYSPRAEVGGASAFLGPPLVRWPELAMVPRPASPFGVVTARLRLGGRGL